MFTYCIMRLQLCQVCCLVAVFISGAVVLGASTRSSKQIDEAARVVLTVRNVVEAPNAEVAQALQTCIEDIHKSQLADHDVNRPMKKLSINFAEAGDSIDGFTVEAALLGSTGAAAPEVEGELVRVISKGDGDNACTPIKDNKMNNGWIAVMQIGDCKFTENSDASAVVTYNNNIHSEDHQSLDFGYGDQVLSVLTSHIVGQCLVNLMDIPEARFVMHITALLFPEPATEMKLSSAVLRATLLPSSISAATQKAVASCIDDIRASLSHPTDIYAIYEAEQEGPVTSDAAAMGFSVEGSLYGLSSPTDVVDGALVHVVNEDGENHSCEPITNDVPSEVRWVALARRGDCKFSQKIHHAVQSTASAVIIYNNDPQGGVLAMKHKDVDPVVSVFANYQIGNCMADLLDNHKAQLHMHISKGKTFETLSDEEEGGQEARANMLVAISLGFIAFLVIGMMSIIAYVVRRSKYIQDKNRRTPIVFSLQGLCGRQEENLLSAEHSGSDHPHPPQCLQPLHIQGSTV